MLRKEFLKKYGIYCPEDYADDAGKEEKADEDASLAAAPDSSEQPEVNAEGEEKIMAEEKDDPQYSENDANNEFGANQVNTMSQLLNYIYEY